MTTLEELCPSILKAVNDINPRWLFTVGTDGLTGHPDHILIRRAIDDVMLQLGKRAPTVLGSKVRTSDIVAAHQLLGSRGIESAGSGRLVGTIEELDTCVAPFFPGDSIVLRSVFDVTGWNEDRFEC